MTAALPYITPHWPGLPANVGALATVRAGGVSQGPYGDGQGGGGLNLGQHVGDDPAHVLANRARLATVLPAQPAWLSQVHGVAVADAGKLDGCVPDADASVATQPGAVCVVMTADCLPVLFCSTDGLVVGAAHAAGAAWPMASCSARWTACVRRARRISLPGWGRRLVRSNSRWDTMCCKRSATAREMMRSGKY